jgi:hypothetical protein
VDSADQFKLTEFLDVYSDTYRKYVGLMTRVLVDSLGEDIVILLLDDDKYKFKMNFEIGKMMVIKL